MSLVGGAFGGMGTMGSIGGYGLNTTLAAPVAAAVPVHQPVLTQQRTVDVHVPHVSRSARAPQFLLDQRRKHCHSDLQFH